MIRPRIVCRDGASVGVQASRGHYCKPTNNVGPYTHVEAEYPSVMPPESWQKYAEFPDSDLYQSAIYPYLPWSCVEEFIEVHGGLDGEFDLPPTVR